MAKHTVRFLVTALAAVLAACGGGGNKTQVEFASAGGEVSIRQNLVFTFSQNMVPGTMVNDWQDTEYIRFEPAVEGKFRWTSVNELTFSPAMGFAPSTAYKATFTEAVTQQSDTRPGMPNPVFFTFSTPSLQLSGADVFWAVSNTGAPEMRMNLNFNYKVAPDDIKNKLQVKVDGQEVPFQLASAAPGESIQVSLTQGGVQETDGKAIDIRIAKGLKVQNAGQEAGELVFVSQVPSKERFRVLQAVAGFDGGETYIQVFTNQAIRSADIRKLIALEPGMANLTVEKLDFGFIVRGPFEMGTNYSFTVDRRMQGVFEGDLGTDFQQNILFGEVDPSLGFANKKAFYLSSKGEKNIGVRIVNVPEVRVLVYKIYQNNILAFLREIGQLNSYSYDDYGYDDDYYYYADYSRYGDLVHEKVYKPSDLPKAQGLNLLNLSFPDINGLKGIYALEIQAADRQYVRATKVVCVSDIGLISRQTPEETLVFANSIAGATPLQGAKVTLVSSNNQEVLTVNTDTQGAARFADLKSRAKGFNVQMVFAEKDGDFTYMHYQQSRIETSAFETGGYRTNEAGLQAFIYGDRDLYRPGENINLKTVIRDNEWRPYAGVPVIMRILLPNGKEFTRQKGTLSNEGSFETVVKMPENTVTGTYSAEILTANNVLLGSRNISVEEFMPDRIRVLTNLSASQAKPGEKLTLSAEALNLFGPPAANRSYEAELTLTAKYFSPKGLEDYNFELTGRTSDFNNDLREGSTAEDGKITETFAIPQAYRNQGLLEGRFYLTVFDETGRPVNRLEKADIVTQEAFYGIKNFDRYVTARQPLAIPLIAVNHEGQVFSSRKARVQVVRYEWQNILEKDYYGRFRYVAQKKEVVMVAQDITLSGNSTTFPFVPAQSGEYEVRVMEGAGSTNHVAAYFYAYGWGATQSTAFEVDRDGQVLIETDKEKYQPGEEANIILKAPFAGKMLITVEREKVLDYFYVDTDSRAASVKLQIKPNYLPNAYITATLIKPVGDADIPLTVAHGFAPVFVEEPASRIPLEIKASDKTRSSTAQEITVVSGLKEADIEITLAVVDEGILQIKNYQTPDPHGYFYQKRALEVSPYDLYPRLFPELRPQAGNFGSDGYDLGKRLNPLTNKRVKLVSFWSGTLKTDRKGQVTYKVDIPRFSGELRIMAVAVRGNAFGSASQAMTVADPLVVSTGLPRFLSPGDEVEMPVTVTNTTGSETTAKVSFVADGAASAQGSNSQSLTISPNSEGRAVFRLAAANAIGHTKVTVNVTGASGNYTDTVSLTVRPPVSLIKTSGAGVVASGKQADLDFKKDFLSSSVDARLLVSRSPMMQLAHLLDRLISYPHGCLEQTISTAFPQLYLADIGRAIGTATGSNTNPEANVQAAIRKIYTMQLYNGGLAYWPGGSYESWWGSVYSAHFLQEAKKAGFDVDDNFLKRLYAYLGTQLKRKDLERYNYYNAANQLMSQQVAPREITYSLYVLALAGKQEVSVMNYYRNKPELLTVDAKYLLASTYQLIGDNSSFRKLVPDSFGGGRSVNAFGGSFYSHIRDQALALNVLMETDPQNAQTGTLARQLTEQLRNAKYLNTQEKAFALLGLGKMAKRNAASTATAKITVGGSQIGNLDQGSQQILVSSADLAGKQVRIQAEGQGDIFYFWQMEGLNETGSYPETDNFLKVRREFYNRQGAVINGSTFSQNDLVVVKITLQTATGQGNVENVVVTDMLPAGFEIENPRIGEAPGMDWIKNQSHPDHFDFRDDRVNFFATATQTPKDYYYVVRAVTKGTYKLGPVAADAMYNGEYHSYNGGGSIKVE